jgi:C-terminal processing protease CtpA/Prc
MRSQTAMIAFLLALALASMPPSPAQARDDKSGVLTFEAAGTAKPLDGWNGSPSGAEGALFLDSTVVHEGRYAGRIERTAASPGTFSAFALALPVDFSGDTLELRGWLKLENVSTHAGLWQRQDGPAGTYAFDNMEAHPNTGTVDWKEYSVRLPLHPKARTVSVGVLLEGTGRVWADDLRLLVDGKPLAEAPALARAPTVLETDHEFDGGSGVTITEVTSTQVANLVLLGKVWGFLKYHHPAAVLGQRHWDYELFRVLPAVLAARDRAGAQQACDSWVTSLGQVPPCTTCVALPEGRPMAPRLEWLSDRQRLGADLSGRLRAIHAARLKVDEQFYVAKIEGIGNPDFNTELAYADLKEPDAGYRLLGLFRFWNMVEYWYPYRDIMQEDWDGVLAESVPRLIEARGRDEYQAAMMAAIARIHDTHANLWSSLDVQPPRGKGTVPVVVRFVESRAVVTGYSNPRLGPATGLQVGDVIRAIDGVAVDELVRSRRPMYAASNEASQRRDMGRRLLRGDPGRVRLSIRHDGRSRDLEVERAPLDSIEATAGRTHDHPGPTIRRLSDDLAYLKLSSVKGDEVADYLSKAAGARCLVIDIRNYPSDFMVFALGQHLVKEPTPFARFTTGDVTNPGSFDWTEPLALDPEEPTFEGRVAILIDEATQSSAEYTTMAFRSAPHAIVVGSTTAGADGNVSPIPLPGGLRGMFTGIGVFYPDKSPTQRVGIVPDVRVTPTIAGIRAGRDEVLEMAVRQVLGREMTAGERAALDGGGGK